jgi:hypothetical protein
MKKVTLFMFVLIIPSFGLQAATDCSSGFNEVYNKYSVVWDIQVKSNGRSIGEIMCHERYHEGGSVKCGSFTAYPNGTPSWLGTTNYESFRSFSRAKSYLREKNCKK